MDEAQLVAVAAAQLVREVNALGDFAHDVEADRIVDAFAEPRTRRLGARVQQGAEVATVHVLEHDEVFALGGNAQIVNLDDVLVRQRGVDARLDLKHLHETRVVGQARQQAFDDDHLFETFFATRPPEIQLGHGAHGKAVEELVVAQARSRGGGEHGGSHGWRCAAHRLLCRSTFVAVITAILGS